MLYQVDDWDDAYANAAHIPDGEGFITRWQDRAAAFREYHPPLPLADEGVQTKGHLFLPESGIAKGLAVFIHGGYWLRFAPSFWSHLAKGPLTNGWAVAMPGYTLAPDAPIAQMTQEVAHAIVMLSARIDGPIAIAGHSAGGHLAARMICDDDTLPDDVARRITACMPISGLCDLRPLLRLKLNQTLKLDAADAAAESPALLAPREGIPVTAWVGGAERPEFIRQSHLLANVWAGLGAPTECIVEPGRHHFDVIDALADPESAMTQRLLAH